MAKLIPAEIKYIKGRTDYDIKIILSELLFEEWLNSEECIWNNIRFVITSYCIECNDCDEINIEFVYTLKISILDIPDDIETWIISFPNLIDYSYSIETNYIKRKIPEYIQHDFLLQDKIDDSYTIYYFDTYDLLNGKYESKVYFLNDDESGLLETKIYKDKEEAAEGHEELIKKWREELIDND